MLQKCHMPWRMPCGFTEIVGKAGRLSEMPCAFVRLQLRAGSNVCSRLRLLCVDGVGV